MRISDQHLLGRQKVFFICRRLSGIIIFLWNINQPLRYSKIKILFPFSSIVKGAWERHRPGMGEESGDPSFLGLSAAGSGVHHLSWRSLWRGCWPCRPCGRWGPPRTRCPASGSQWSTGSPRVWGRCWFDLLARLWSRTWAQCYRSRPGAWTTWSERWCLWHLSLQSGWGRPSLWQAEETGALETVASAKGWAESGLAVFQVPECTFRCILASWLILPFGISVSYLISYK